MESNWRWNVAEQGWAGEQWHLMALVREGPYVGEWLRASKWPRALCTVGITSFLSTGEQVFLPDATFYGKGFPFGLPVYGD